MEKIVESYVTKTSPCFGRQENVAVIRVSEGMSIREYTGCASMNQEESQKSASQRYQEGEEFHRRWNS